MENKSIFTAAKPKNEEEAKLFESLEQRNNWDGVPMYKIQDFWCPFYLIRPLLSLQQNFKSHDSDIILASVPKSGTTWMKALLFSIIRRMDFPINQSPVLSNSSHRLVLSIECDHYLKEEHPDMESIPDQLRLFSTHLPYQGLGTSVANSKSKIVYICRNPLDQFISEREFLIKSSLKFDGMACGEMLTAEEGFDLVCDGVQAFGPYWDHLLGYWNASMENPDKVLFLKYEDMKRDPVPIVKKIAEFVNLPFSEQEEEQGLVEEIVRLCSFDKLKNLEVNKTGVHYQHMLNHVFYRKGDIGDWKNHLSLEKAERMRNMLEEKLGGSGLKIDI